MERLLKLMEQRANLTAPKDKQDAIFDIKTFQKNFDNSLMPPSQLSKYKRMSFSDYSHKHPQEKDQIKYRGTKLTLKEQIKPHQAKHPSNNGNYISQLIRQKLKHVRNQKKREQFQESLVEEDFKSKKNSHSAYITARKKIFQKQSSMGSQSISQTDYSKLCKGEKQKQLQFFGGLKEKDILFLKPIAFQHQQNEINTNEQEQVTEESKITISQRKKNIKYLQRIVTDDKKKSKALAELNMISSRFQDQSCETKAKKGFMTMVKKKKSNLDMLISSPKHKKSSSKVESEPPQYDQILKKFASQSKVEEEQINIFPTIVKIEKQVSETICRIPKQQITCKAVSIMHIKNQIIQTIFASNDRQRLEIASITKIMTCYLILTLCQKFSLDIKTERVMVSERASKMPGTSAKLAYSDTGSIYEMLHGLMLPSGNDAAIALGQWGGKMIRRYSALIKRLRTSELPQKADKSVNFLNNLVITKKSNLKLFIHHMNKLAKHLQLKSTNFANTHGLMNQKAFSCAQDVSCLTYYAMKHQTVREIVRKKHFTCKIFNRTFSHFKQTNWKNTNKLLNIEGFIGVKTGVTPAAGPCLSSMFELSASQYFIIVILRTKSCEMRFRETVNLMKKVFQKLSTQTTKPKRYSQALQGLAKYDKVVLQEDETEILNDCKQSSNSDSEKEDDDLESPL